MLNPFSEERLDSDAEAVGATGAGPEFSHMPGLLDKIERRLAETERLPHGGWRGLEASDAELVEGALLFLVFHRHANALDEYIQAQSERAGAPLPAECGAAIFADLRRRGFAVARAERCVAMFFQLRRAYRFISSGLLGESDSMRKLRVNLWNAIFTGNLRLYLDTLWNRMDDFSILLLGETGTGKGAAATAIGRSNYIPFSSHRAAFTENFNDAFLSINLSEFSESLIESELFGHVKGAFTGAIGDHEGIFARCSRHGAIFLDEIGDVSERIQIKLLQVLQQRLFSPVGGHARLRFGGRLVAATNQDLDRRRAEGKFRNDFYYRLSSSRIPVPSLRRRLAENPGELSLLLGEIVRRLAGAANPSLARAVEERLTQDLPHGYCWPGNVRELEQAARSVIVTGHYHGEALGRDVPSVPVVPSVASAPSSAADDDATRRALAGELSLAELETWYCRRLHARLGSYRDVAARLGIDWRTARRMIGN